MKIFATLACACALGVAAPAAATAATSTSAPSAQDKQYLQTSISGDRFEIQGAIIAERKTKNKAVIKLAKRLMKDHQKSLGDAVALAQKLKIRVPGTPLPSQQWALRMVSQLSGRAFDHWYSSLEVFDHQQDIQETNFEIENGTNGDVVKDARTELPMLHMHLLLAEKALAANR